jgi:hypothetical protein
MQLSSSQVSAADQILEILGRVMEMTINLVMTVDQVVSYKESKGWHMKVGGKNLRSIKSNFTKTSC